LDTRVHDGANVRLGASVGNVETVGSVLVGTNDGAGVAVGPGVGGTDGAGVGASVGADVGVSDGAPSHAEMLHAAFAAISNGLGQYLHAY
jgi:hypothetical protein